MKKLKTKIFWTIFIILSFFSLSVLMLFQIQNYRKEKINIQENLNRMGNEPVKNVLNESDKFNNPKRFLDVTMYTILLNRDNTVLGVISHTEDGSVYEEIEELAEKIVKENKQSKTKIGNLYLNRYSYSYSPSNCIIIIDNQEVQDRLFNLLSISIAFYFLIEMCIFIVSRFLSVWISKPVEESFNKQKQFIADASHELKTPLAVIMASSDALKSNPKEKKWLEAIETESERMNKLITNLLDLAKVENKKEIVEEEINFSKLVEKSLLTLESLLYDSKIALEENIEKEISLKGKSEELKQLLSILMDNAIKHSSKKGKIKVELKQIKNQIYLTVSNKGKPIPKEEEEKIFERFYRGDASHNRDSNRYGLGLAIAKSIVENHHGTIKCSSNNDYTTFIVSFKKEGK